MLFSHHLCVVESYRIGRDRAGAFGDEIILEGWFLAHAAVASMRVVFPDGRVHEVADRNRESEAVWQHHGSGFGERARQARFLLIEPVGEKAPDFAAAEFHVRMEGGEMFVLALGRELRIQPPDENAAAWRELVMGFESCGDNCEFGLMQRRIGTERMGLLRYAGVGDIFALSSAIEHRFVDLDRPGAVGISTHGNEWIAHVPSAGLAFHTGRATDAISREGILAEETRKLVFLGQKFIEDCEDATKIFVYRVMRDERGGPDGTRGIDRLYEAMRTIGPVRLLWVNMADDAHAHGTLQHLRDGLWRGWIDHLAPAPNAFDFRISSWMALLHTARQVMALSRDEIRHAG